MALPQYQDKLTEAQYLEFERDSATRHEYIAGLVLSMTGASMNHNTLKHDLSRLIGNHLADTPYRVWTSDMRLHIPATSSYRYSDVMIVCDPPILTDDHQDTITNPVVLIEVLSPSTQVTDRNDKLREYRTIPSLQAYLLVSQDRPRIERYLRQSDADWLYSEASGMDTSFAIAPLNLTLALADVYRKVDFAG